MLTLNKINDIINSRKKTKFKKVVMIMEKYEIVKDMAIEYKGRTLYRIRALKNFDDIKTGDLGGYVESYNNLSQKGNCWIFNNAKVYDDARVYDDAKIYEYAEVYENGINNQIEYLVKRIKDIQFTIDNIDKAKQEYNDIQRQIHEYRLKYDMNIMDKMGEYRF